MPLPLMEKLHPLILLPVLQILVHEVSFFGILLLLLLLLFLTQILTMIIPGQGIWSLKGQFGVRAPLYTPPSLIIIILPPTAEANYPQTRRQSSPRGLLKTEYLSKKYYSSSKDLLHPCVSLSPASLIKGLNPPSEPPLKNVKTKTVSLMFKNPSRETQPVTS